MSPDQKIERIQRALDRDGTHDWVHIRELLKAGKCQIFDSEHGSWITEVISTPKARLLNCWVVAGELPGVMDLQAEVERYAAQENCARMTATGRRGWKNIARDYGWNEAGTLISRKVN